MPDYTPLWEWVLERELVRLKREAGEPYPWTDNPILATYRFCNVRREDDRVTIWIRDYIRRPYKNHPYLWLMLCIARQINWPDTLAYLIAQRAWPLDETNPCPAITNALNEWQAKGNKVYTGAYMISAPAEKGANKQKYIAETVIGDLWQRRDEFRDWNSATLQSTHTKIRQSLGWGAFMAYQAVVDMRFTPLLENAKDIYTWAAAGPGTIRGLNRLYNRDLTYALSQEQALDEMREIYAQAYRETGIPMDFSDVPNILCETDKYLRVRLNQGRPRAKYIPVGGY